MKEIFRYKTIFGLASIKGFARICVPEEIYKDREAMAAWINLTAGTSFKASELHWHCPAWATPTNSLGPL